MNGKYTRSSLLCCFAALFLAMVVYAQGGFTGPSQTSSNAIKVTGKGQIQATAASSVKNLSYDAPVMLIGNITQAIGHDLYKFRDSSGEISVRIKEGDWKGMQIGTQDSVVVVGHVKHIAEGHVEVDAKVIASTNENVTINRNTNIGMYEHEKAKKGSKKKAY